MILILFWKLVKFSENSRNLQDDFAKFQLKQNEIKVILK